MKPEIIVALDLPSRKDIKRVLDELPEAITWYKIGFELFTAEGPAALTLLRDRGKRIFLDLKLHDIPRTVARTVTAAARHQISLLTIHAGGGRDMLRAASEAATAGGGTGVRLLAVTTLTSLAQEDLLELDVRRPLREHTLNLGELAVSCGADGLVCSALEARIFREKLGTQPLLVTPGIRPAGTDKGDQRRVATPAVAVQAGANFLVMGRAILEADDPCAAALDALQQIEEAYSRLSN